jgi:TPR repeat protein
LLAVLKHLKVVKYPAKTPALDRLEELALVEENPRAILAYCKVLGRREQHREAIALLEKLMRRIYPTKTRQLIRDDITLYGRLEAPWWEYSWHKARLGEFDASEEMLRLGAMEYQEPRAMVEYAFILWQKDDAHGYLECMNKAATAGNAEACLKLANYYYLKSLEKRVAPEVQEPDGFSVKVQRWLGMFRTADDYRELAMDWYEISALHGNHDAALILAMILREDGDSKGGLRWLGHIERFNDTATAQTKKFPNGVWMLRERWDNADFRPAIPEPLLSVDR